MRITWVVVLGSLLGVLALRLGGPTPAQAADRNGDDEPRLVSTNGMATVRVKPDSARVFFSVTNAASTVPEVRKQNNTAVNRVMEKLGALPIPQKFAKTSTVNVSIVWRDSNHLQIEGYRMTTQFTVRVVNEDVDKLASEAGLVVDVALEEGANEISQIVFFREDDRAEKLECLKLAVKNAKENAEALADAAGLRLGQARNISGSPEYAPRYDYYNAMVQSASPGAMGGEGPASAFTPGEIELSCNVSATYELRG